MSGRKLDNATYNVTTDWQDETESKSLLKKGWYNLDWTELDGIDESIIQSGSSVDIDGVLYVFDSNETPTGTEVAGINYIVAYDSGGVAIVEYTQTAPEDFDYEKNGQYDSTGTKRYIMKFNYATSSYSHKVSIATSDSLDLDILNRKISSLSISTWFEQSIHLSTVNNITYGGGQFVAVRAGAHTDNIATSPDGITWTSRTGPDTNKRTDVTYGDGLYVAVSDEGHPNQVITSADGITWTQRTTPVDGEWYGVTYGNGIFVAVASAGSTGNRVMTSPDGINWTIRTTPADLYWRSVNYGNGLFLATSISTATNNIMTSPDGITWTQRTKSYFAQTHDAVYAQGLWVVAASSGRIYTSPDGITWTEYIMTETHDWKGATYAEGQFVVVSDDTGNINKIASSPDGINWTIRGIQEGQSGQYQTIAYGDSKFIIGAGGGSPVIMSSLVF